MKWYKFEPDFIPVLIYGLIGCALFTASVLLLNHLTRDRKRAAGSNDGRRGGFH
jgi:hypothetical protein